MVIEVSRHAGMAKLADAADLETNARSPHAFTDLQRTRIAGGQVAETWQLQDLAGFFDQIDAS